MTVDNGCASLTGFNGTVSNLFRTPWNMFGSILGAACSRYRAGDKDFMVHFKGHGVLQWQDLVWQILSTQWIGGIQLSRI
jgi:hypothetical protein